jgi:CRISPR-associated protein Cmr4
MNSLILGLLAETAVHPGAGQSSGAIDLPVAREAATDYPVVTGSSLKGALASFAREQVAAAAKVTLPPQATSPTPASEQTDASAAAKTKTGENFGKIFGTSDNAGTLLVSDARLLLLPVRSLDSAYKWVTCPHLLERWQRDIARAGDTSPKLLDLSDLKSESGKFLGTAKGELLFLEERQFARIPDSDGKIAKLAEELKPYIKHIATRERLSAQLVILHDDDFVWFARNGLGIQARNVLDENTKESKNLWYEEFIPADALFYAVLAERIGGAADAVKSLLEKRPYLQLGGNETVGMGWFAVSIANASNVGADTEEGGVQ